MVKLCDFGVCHVGHRATGRLVDNPLWLAVEVIAGNEYTSKVLIIIIFSFCIWVQFFVYMLLRHQPARVQPIDGNEYASNALFCFIRLLCVNFFFVCVVVFSLFLFFCTFLLLIEWPWFFFFTCRRTSTASAWCCGSSWRKKSRLQSFGLNSHRSSKQKFWKVFGMVYILQQLLMYACTLSQKCEEEKHLFNTFTQTLPFPFLFKYFFTYQVTDWALHRPPIPPHCPDVFRELITRCWSHEPHDRPTAAELLKLLNGFNPGR